MDAGVDALYYSDKEQARLLFIKKEPGTFLSDMTRVQICLLEGGSS